MKTTTFKKSDVRSELLRQLSCAVRFQDVSGGMRLLEQDCVGHIPEILDGDFPHSPRGCGAQAWSASEMLRVLLKLS